jgi:hypothetical protein
MNRIFGLVVALSLMPSVAISGEFPAPGFHWNGKTFESDEKLTGPFVLECMIFGFPDTMPDALPACGATYKTKKECDAVVHRLNLEAKGVYTIMGACNQSSRKDQSRLSAEGPTY